MPLERPASLDGGRSFLRRTMERCAGAAAVLTVAHFAGTSVLWGSVGAAGLLLLLTGIDVGRHWLWERRIQGAFGPRSRAALSAESDPDRTLSALIALQSLADTEHGNDSHEQAQENDCHEQAQAQENDRHEQAQSSGSEPHSEERNPTSR